MIKIRTLERIDDPQRPGASIRSGVTIEIQKAQAERWIAEGKAELVSDEPVKREEPADKESCT